MEGDDISSLLVPGDAAHLSPLQRIAALEVNMAKVYPMVVGVEQPDGTTKPGVLRRLEKIERTLYIGGYGGFTMWIVSTFGLTDSIKHFVVVLLGGKI